MVTMQAAARGLLAAPSPGVALAPRSSCSARPGAWAARPRCLLAGHQAPAAAAGRAGAAAGALPTQFGSRHAAPLRRGLASQAGSRLRRRAAAGSTRAMVNVDVSPSVVLGVGLIGAGVSLWQIRRVKPWISKDYDVVVSCISLLVGGILIFQGWRLDPLLLFGQLMTTGAAVSFAIEALRLRSEMYESEEKAALQDVFKRKGPGGGGAGGAFQLPPPEAGQAAPWADAAAGEQAWAAAQQWQQQQPAAMPAAEYYDYQQQGQAAAGGAYGYDQQQAGAWDGAAAGGLYQAAEYEAPAADQGAAGADYGYGYPSSSGSAGGSPPSELAFPASYSEPGAPAADGSAGSAAGGWGGAYGSQQPGGGSAPGGGSRAYDNMDDW